MSGNPGQAVCPKCGRTVGLIAGGSGRLSHHKIRHPYQVAHEGGSPRDNPWCNAPRRRADELCSSHTEVQMFRLDLIVNLGQNAGGEVLQFGNSMRIATIVKRFATLSQVQEYLERLV